MDVTTHDHGDIKERAFKGLLHEALAAAAEFIKHEDFITVRSIQTLEITAEKWRIGVYYKEV